MENNYINKLVDTFKSENDIIKNNIKKNCDYTVEEYYIKNKVENGYHSVDCIFKFEKYSLKMEYKVNVGMILPKSTIEMRFMFSEGTLPVEYSIYDLFNLIDMNNFKCYTFPYIDNEEKMKASINYLIEAFLNYEKDIESLAENREKLQQLESNIKQQIINITHEDIFLSKSVSYLSRMLELYYFVDTSRFTSKNYLYVLKGKYHKAIKRYDKNKEKLTIYEKRLVNYLKDENKVKDILPEELKTLEQATKLKKGGIRELVAMYASWIILTPIWFLIYFIIYKIADLIINNGALYVAGSYDFALFMPAFLTAIVNSYFTRKIVYKIIFRKRYEEIIKLEAIEMTKFTKVLMIKFFQFVIAASIVFSILVANTNVIFYENGFKDKLDILNLKGNFIEYSEVNKVYKVSNFVDDLKNTDDNYTYIIELKNGDKLNWYYDLDNVEIERKIIPIFKLKGVDIDMNNK